jgi:hypothetical protein
VGAATTKKRRGENAERAADEARRMLVVTRERVSLYLLHAALPSRLAALQASPNIPLYLRSSRQLASARLVAREISIC